MTFEELLQDFPVLKENVNEIKQFLLFKGNEPQKQDEQLLSIKEAAKFLNLSVPTLYGYVHRAELPVLKRAGRLYFYRYELMNWLEGGRKKTVAELASEADAYLSNQKKKGARS